MRLEFLLNLILCKLFLGLDMHNLDKEQNHLMFYLTQHKQILIYLNNKALGLVKDKQFVDQ